MKPISLPLPLIGLLIRVEALEAQRRRVAAPPSSVVHASRNLKQALGRRVLQDIGLDKSRQD